MDNIRKNKFYSSIDKIVWEKWDPIGINNNLNIRNEYYGYIPIIFEKALNSNDEKELANVLFSIETDRIGLDGNYEKCLMISKEILKEKGKV